MRILLIVAWLFVGLGGVIYHLGPGQEKLEIDRVNAMLKKARLDVTNEDWKQAVDQFDEILAEIPAEKVNETRSVVLEKAKAQHGVDVETLVKDESVKIILDHASERNLALQLNMFADTMELTLEDMFPYHICDYVYALANASSDFVTQCKVLGSDEMKSRLLLCYMTAKAMGDCFDLLGIRHIKRI